MSHGCGVVTQYSFGSVTRKCDTCLRDSLGHTQSQCSGESECINSMRLLVGTEGLIIREQNNSPSLPVGQSISCSRISSIAALSDGHISGARKTQPPPTHDSSVSRPPLRSWQMTGTYLVPGSDGNTRSRTKHIVRSAALQRSSTAAYSSLWYRLPSSGSSW